jgi:tetratricopeptide (TPR) repeat protein
VATAGAQFERAVMLWPQQWTYAQYLAAVRIQEAFAADVDTSAARAAFRSAVDVLRVADGQVPESETALALASLYRGLGDREAHPTAQIDAWTTAEDWYQAALARAPLDPDVLVEGGRLRERFGDVKSAGRLYSKALDLQPALAVADMGLARSAMAQGDLAAAERALTAAGQLVGTGKLVTLATADDWAAGASAVQTAAMARALSGDREGARSSLEALGSGSSTDAVTAALLRWLDRPTAGQP